MVTPPFPEREPLKIPTGNPIASLVFGRHRNRAAGHPAPGCTRRTGKVIAKVWLDTGHCTACLPVFVLYYTCIIPVLYLYFSAPFPVLQRGWVSRLLSACAPSKPIVACASLM